MVLALKSSEFRCRGFFIVRETIRENSWRLVVKNLLRGEDTTSCLTAVYMWICLCWASLPRRNALFPPHSKSKFLAVGC